MQHPSDMTISMRFNIVTDGPGELQYNTGFYYGGDPTGSGIFNPMQHPQVSNGTGFIPIEGPSGSRQPNVTQPVQVDSSTETVAPSLPNNDQRHHHRRSKRSGGESDAEKKRRHQHRHQKRHQSRESLPNEERSTTSTRPGADDSIKSSNDDITVPAEALQPALDTSTEQIVWRYKPEDAIRSASHAPVNHDDKTTHEDDIPLQLSFNETLVSPPPEPRPSLRRPDPIPNSHGYRQQPAPVTRPIKLFSSADSAQGTSLFSSTQTPEPQTSTSSAVPSNAQQNLVSSILPDTNIPPTPVKRTSIKADQKVKNGTAGPVTKLETTFPIDTDQYGSAQQTGPRNNRNYVDRSRSNTPNEATIINDPHPYHNQPTALHNVPKMNNENSNTRTEPPQHRSNPSLFPPKPNVSTNDTTKSIPNSRNQTPWNSNTQLNRSFDPTSAYSLESIPITVITDSIPEPLTTKQTNIMQSPRLRHYQQPVKPKDAATPSTLSLSSTGKKSGAGKETTFGVENSKITPPKSSTEGNYESDPHERLAAAADDLERLLSMGGMIPVALPAPDYPGSPTRNRAEHIYMEPNRVRLRETQHNGQPNEREDSANLARLLDRTSEFLENHYDKAAPPILEDPIYDNLPTASTVSDNTVASSEALSTIMATSAAKLIEELTKYTFTYEQFKDEPYSKRNPTVKSETLATKEPSPPVTKPVCVTTNLDEPEAEKTIQSPRSPETPRKIPFGSRNIPIGRSSGIIGIPPPPSVTTAPNSVSTGPRWDWQEAAESPIYPFNVPTEDVHGVKFQPFVKTSPNIPQSAMIIQRARQPQRSQVGAIERLGSPNRASAPPKPALPPLPMPDLSFLLASLDSKLQPIEEETSTQASMKSRSSSVTGTLTNEDPNQSTSTIVDRTETNTSPTAKEHRSPQGTTNQYSNHQNVMAELIRGYGGGIKPNPSKSNQSHNNHNGGNVGVSSAKIFDMYTKPAQYGTTKSQHGHQAWPYSKNTPKATLAVHESLTASSSNPSSIDDERSSVSGRQIHGAQPNRSNSRQSPDQSVTSENPAEYVQDGRLSSLDYIDQYSNTSTMSRESIMRETSSRTDKPHQFYKSANPTDDDHSGRSTPTPTPHTTASGHDPYLEAKERFLKSPMSTQPAAPLSTNATRTRSTEYIMVSETVEEMVEIFDPPLRQGAVQSVEAKLRHHNHNDGMLVMDNSVDDIDNEGSGVFGIQPPKNKLLARYQMPPDADTASTTTNLTEENFQDYKQGRTTPIYQIDVEEPDDESNTIYDVYGSLTGAKTDSLRLASIINNERDSWSSSGGGTLNSRNVQNWRSTGRQGIIGEGHTTKPTEIDRIPRPSYETDF